VGSLFERVTARATLHAAFERVRERGGCRGADGMTVGGFAADLESEIGRLQDRLVRGRYRPFPLLRFSVAKGGEGGTRPLSVPMVRDRVAQTAVYLATRELFEREYEEASHAYRQGRSVRTAVHRVNDLRQRGYRFLVHADIDAFFDSIPHARLLGHLRKLPLDARLLHLFELWIATEIYDGERVYPAERGVPQGSVVSPMLANLFLDELDESLALFGQAVVRYADDLLVLCRSRAEAEAALELTDYLVAELELHLDREKTTTTSFDQGFEFLGAIFVKDSIYLPFERRRPEPSPPLLPPPLDLWTYLEMRARA
jgi:group II intron reverse transcriptase/maturase